MQLYWTPCSPGDPAAVEKTWMDVSPGELKEPIVSLVRTPIRSFMHICLRGALCVRASLCVCVCVCVCVRVRPFVCTAHFVWGSWRVAGRVASVTLRMRLRARGRRSMGRTSFGKSSGRRSLARRGKPETHAPTETHTHTRTCTHAHGHVCAERCGVCARCVRACWTPAGVVWYVRLCVCVCVCVCVRCRPTVYVQTMPYTMLSLCKASAFACRLGRCHCRCRRRRPCRTSGMAGVHGDQHRWWCALCAPPNDAQIVRGIHTHKDTYIHIGARGYALTESCTHRLTGTNTGPGPMCGGGPVSLCMCMYV
jgi:hypothetical protein